MEVEQAQCGWGKYQTPLSILPHREYETIGQARRMSTGLTNVRYAQADMCDFQTQSHVFDLIVLADVLYYLAPLNDRMLKLLGEKIARLLSPGGCSLTAISSTLIEHRETDP